MATRKDNATVQGGDVAGSHANAKSTGGNYNRIAWNEALSTTSPKTRVNGGAGGFASGRALRRALAKIERRGQNEPR